MTAGAGEPSLDPALRRAEHLVAAASVLAFALDDLTIELPPTSGAAIDQAQLRAIAALYLASQLESAGLVQAAEDLVRLARTGALRVNLRDSGALLDAFWRTRNERASPEERQSFFAGLFGEDGTDSTSYQPNTAFEDGLIDLCEALYKLDELPTNRQWGGIAQQARVRTAAERLLDNLSRRSGSITAFMAKEILATLRQAIGILTDRAVQAAFGTNTLPDVVAAVGRHAQNDAGAGFWLFTRRGEAGMTILAWLAEAAPLLRSSRPLLAIDHPVIAAAIEWLETSLKLTEMQPPAGHARSGAGRPEESGWAALAG